MPASRHGQADTIHAPRSSFRTGRFGRLFRNLEPFAPPAGETDRDFSTRLAAEMVEPDGADKEPSLDNDTIPAAYTYFGQFVDHDITFDPISMLMRRNDPDLLHNFRTPRFDLDNVYGRGPHDQPFLYDQNNPGKMLLGEGQEASEVDLPRNEQEVALIGDPRNDENTIVSQIQLAFLMFHNAVVDRLAAAAQPPEDLFRTAQRIVRWTYQYVVLNDFLPRLVQEKTLRELRPDPAAPRASKLSFYKPVSNAFMPVEFSVAAYRLGHSMVRNTYSLSQRLDEARTGAGVTPEVPIFVPGRDVGPLEDLRGGKLLPGLWSLQWNRFLDFTGSDPQLSRKLDTKLAKGLSLIPAGPGGQNALAFLNLQRGFALELPSGQSVSRAMGRKPKVNPDGHDQLWWYVLREAETEENGRRLGEVGGTIVAEVFIGMLESDRESYLNIDPCWDPCTEPLIDLSPIGDTFELRDIIKLAGLPITAEDFTAPTATWSGA